MRLEGLATSFSRSRSGHIAVQVLPWVGFGAFMLWMWGERDPFRTLPVYGDALEPVAAASWLGEAVAQGQNPLVYPLNYFPEGWHIASQSTGFLLYAALAPAARFFGGAFAYNLAFLFTCLLAFSGALLLARRLLSPLPATFVALALTFWGLRWFQAMEGHLNILLGSALLPWMLWSVERSFYSARSRMRWLAVAGLFWSLSFIASPYFVYVGVVVLGVWMLLPRSDDQSTWRKRLLNLGFVFAAFLLFSSPSLILTARETAIADPPYYRIAELNYMSASLNSLPIPSLFSPWLGSVARLLYHGLPWEQNSANFGLVASLAALLGAIVVWRSKTWRPAVMLVVVGGLLSLGLTLHWNGEAVQWQVLRPLNHAIWQIGYALKPDLFETPQPPAPFEDAVPLPGLLLVILLPFFERGRMFARYALAASLGVYLLAGLAVAEVRRTWLRAIAAGALIFEIVPPPLEAVPFPPATHPAYVWLSQQQLSGEGIANVFAAHESTLVLAIYAYNLLAPSYHKQATVAGTGVVPRHIFFLNNWLATHQHPFWQPDFALILRAYRVRYIVLEMRGTWEEGLWKEAQVADEVRPVQCFPNPRGRSPWHWPICILEVPPSRSPDLNLLLHDGWSGKEAWGVWAEGTESDAQWIATSLAPARLALSVFPQCVPGRYQEIRLDFNGTTLATHKWADCERWTASVDIPAALVRVGANDLSLHSAYATPPPPKGNVRGDTRQLSVGFTELRIDRAANAKDPVG
jgi:hypothetical protein